MAHIYQCCQDTFLRDLSDYSSEPLALSGPCCGASHNPEQMHKLLVQNLISSSIYLSQGRSNKKKKIKSLFPSFFSCVKRSEHTDRSGPVYLRLFEKPCKWDSSEKHGVVIEAHSCIAMRLLIYIPTPHRGHISQNPDGLSRSHCQKLCSRGQTPPKHNSTRAESDMW